MIKGIPIHCFEIYWCRIILCYDLKISKTTLMCFPFRDKVYRFFPCLRLLTEGSKYRPAPLVLEGNRSCLRQHFPLDIVTCTKTNPGLLIGLAARSMTAIYNRQKGQSELMCGFGPFGKTAGIVCRRRHNGVSVQNQHKWKVVRVEESEGEKIEGGREKYVLTKATC